MTLPLRVYDWPENWRELWRERSAIMQFEAGLTESEADREAEKDIRRVAESQ